MFAVKASPVKHEVHVVCCLINKVYSETQKKNIFDFLLENIEKQTSIFQFLVRL